MFLLLSPQKWETDLEKMNEAIREHNGLPSTVRPIKVFTVHEYCTCRALMIAAVCWSEKGDALFPNGEDTDFASLASSPNFSQYIKEFRFKEYRRFIPAAMASKDRQIAGDPWWQFSEYVDHFNETQLREVNFSLWHILDETMSALRPRKSKTGNLPNITFLLRKPEPLGTEFKDSGCSVHGGLRFLEIQRGRLGMHEKEFWSELGATGACTLRIAKGGAQPTLEGQKEGVKADAWFGSVTCADALGQHGFKSIMSVSKIILYFVYNDFTNIPNFNF